jgi:HNH endonuclease
VDNLDNLEIGSSARLKLARNVAIREFLFHHDICRSPHQCWEWRKYRNEKGYGTIIFDGFKFNVHRLSFEHYKGRIPKGMLVMHECDNPPCYNPAHLFLGTHAENMQDMVRKGRHKSQKQPVAIVLETRSPELRNEPALLERLKNERERVSWAWRNPA